MRRALRRSAAACLCAGSLSLTVDTADVLAQLGIPLQAAKDAAGTAISSGVSNPGLPSKLFKTLSASARAEAATAGVAWLKIYTASAEFQQHYAKIRDTHKPEPPQFEGTPEEELKKADEDQKADAEESKKAIASLPAEQRKALEDALKQSAAMLARMDTPEMRKVRLDGIRMARAERTKQYEQEFANWKRDYPDHPNGAIAKRLREFLTMSADVDFAAKVKSQDGRLLFENAGYEAKSAQWKMCYRAGREATTAARAAVSAWLKDIAP